MPGWSTEIANEFIRLAAANQQALDQSRLQKLVYIAHGWSLAFYDRPLTGDRPEAWTFGPVYRRLADVLAAHGRDVVIHQILADQATPAGGAFNRDGPNQSDLDLNERDLIATVYQNYGQLAAAQLSNWTRKGAAPWGQVFANGSGEFRDISHKLVKAQFFELAKQSEEHRPTTRNVRR